MDIPLQQPLDQEVLHFRDPEFSKALTDSSLCPSTSFQVRSPMNWAFQTLQYLWSLDLILVPPSQPHCPPSTPYLFSPSVSFPFMFFLHSTAKLFTATVSPGHCGFVHFVGHGGVYFWMSHLLVLCSHTFGLPVAAGENHSAMPMLMSFSLYFQSYRSLSTARESLTNLGSVWFSFPPV